LVATSEPQKTVLPDDYDTSNEGGRFPAPLEDKYTLKLFSSSWREMDKYVCEDHEKVLCMDTVFLSKEEVNSDDEDDDVSDDGHKKEKNLMSLLAVGTGINLGEDEACVGRILIFDLEPDIDASNESSESSYKLSPICEKDLKGPVSAIAHVQGYLIVSVGPKLYVYFFDWNNKQLVPASFFDAQFYATSMKTIKNYILYADMFEGLHFVRWREKGHRLTLLGKDYRHLTAGGALADIYSSDYLVDYENLGLVALDGEKNLQIFEYAPKSAESITGKRLLPTADFHIGSHIVATMRMKMRKLDSKLDPIVEFSRGRDRINVRTNARRQFLLFGTMDGGISYLACIDETTHRRLSALQTKMYTQLAHHGGLHPKAFRSFKSKGDHHIHKKNIVDGQLLWRYAHLNTVTQKDLARSTGTTTELVLSNMQELNQLTFFF
jgi:cleavage and polyadenylation specificity factor subunit 1